MSHSAKEDRIRGDLFECKTALNGHARGLTHVAVISPGNHLLGLAAVLSNRSVCKYLHMTASRLLPTDRKFKPLGQPVNVPVDVLDAVLPLDAQVRAIVTVFLNAVGCRRDKRSTKVDLPYWGTVTVPQPQHPVAVIDFDQQLLFSLPARFAQPIPRAANR